jgi:acetyl-CoA C-acetyltransferase
MGNVIHTEPRDAYLSRVAAIEADIPFETSALTVNRLCGFGLQAIISAAQTIMPGDADIADGGTALVLVSGSHLPKRAQKPMARLVAYGRAGVDPKYMGSGPIPALQKALKKAGLNINDIDVIESNDAFAAQACAVAQDLEFQAERVNPNGGAVALGHPIGASGAIIAIKALYELERIHGRYELVTICIGGGQGIAAVFERL